MNTGGPEFPRHGWTKDPQVLELERELNAATERIKRLEDAGNDVVWWFCHQIEPSQLSPVQTSALKKWRDLRVGRNP